MTTITHGAPQRLLDEERRLHLVVQALEARVRDKRARGHLVPLGLRDALEEFRRSWAAVRRELDAIAP